MIDAELVHDAFAVRADRGHSQLQFEPDLLGRVPLHEQIHEKVVSIPHGWWLPEEPGPDHGVFEVCSNVLVDDDPDNCDVVLGSSPLKGLLCRISKAEAPARTISQRWKEAMAAE